MNFSLKLTREFLKKQQDQLNEGVFGNRQYLVCITNEISCPVIDFKPLCF